MTLTVLMVDDHNKVLARGSVNAMAGDNGWIYAMEDGEADVTEEGSPTHAVVVLSGLVKIKTKLPGIPPYVFVGDHLTLKYANQVIAETEGLMDPLEVE